MVATAAVLSSTASAPGSVVAEGCATTDHGAYTAMLCLHVAGGPLSGEAPVSVTFSSSDARTLVRELEVELDGQHLVSDYEDPFEFQLPSYLFGDGNHTLSATALLRDGSRTQPVSFTVAFGNGGQQPAATSFVPTSGTAPIAGRPFIVAAAGDGAGGEQQAADVTNLISSWQPNLFLYLGDVYKDGTGTEYLNWYAPEEYFGRFRAITLPTLGNHEYTKRIAPGYFWYWRGAPHFYSVDAGGWHIVSLFPYTTLFRSGAVHARLLPPPGIHRWAGRHLVQSDHARLAAAGGARRRSGAQRSRSQLPAFRAARRQRKSFNRRADRIRRGLRGAWHPSLHPA